VTGDSHPKTGTGDGDVVGPAEDFATPSVGVVGLTRRSTSTRWQFPTAAAIGKALARPKNLPSEF